MAILLQACRFRKLYPFGFALTDESEHDRRMLAIASRYLVGCTIDMHESELSEATGMVPASAMPNMPHLFAEHEIARCGGYVAHGDYRYRNGSHGHFDDGAVCRPRAEL